MNSLKYLIAMWGGTTNNLHREIQVILNCVARCVTGKGRRTSTNQLMLETGWMTAKEFTSYFTLVESWKIVRMKTSLYMSDKFELEGDEN